MTSMLELLKAKKQQLAAGNRKKTLKLADGTGRYRILPSWRKGSDQFWHDFGQHFIKNAAKEMQAVYVCVDKTFGKPCEICDAVRAGIKGATDDKQLELIKEASAAGRVLVNAVHLDGASPGEVQILELPPTVFGQIVDIMTEWVDAGENPLDPVKGKDLLITRTGTGKNTKYTTQVGAKVTAVSPDVLTKLNDLDAYVAQESAEAQTRALNSVRSVAGLLPAPAAKPAAEAGRMPAGSTIVDDYEVAAPPSKRTAAAASAVKAEEFEDVPSRDVPTPEPAPAAAAESTGDAELDSLLASLG